MAVIIRFLFLLVAVGFMGLSAHAQGATPSRGASERIVHSIADIHSDSYRFEIHLLSSRDDQRRYRIEVAIPRTPAPAQGYSSLYMLDGNAVMDTLTQQDLTRLAGSANPPVLVAIGYDINTRNDVIARAYDYTPPVNDKDGRPIAQPTVRGRVGGGANQFLQLIQEDIKPLLQSRIPLDRDQEMLWGHSFGGLFVLHALLTDTSAFSAYFAADPSLWWHDMAILQQWAHFKSTDTQAHPARLALYQGTRSQAGSHRAAISTAPGLDNVGVLRGMASWFQQRGTQSSVDVFPQFGHGEMIRASLDSVFELLAQPSR